MNRPDAITRAQMPPSSRKNPLTPVIIGVIITIIVFALLIFFTVIIPMTAEQGAEKRSDKLDARVDEVVNQAKENVNNTGKVFIKEPSVPMSPGLLAIEEKFER
ncbi:hypothetical protein [Methanospirillum sp.]|uniref:hypothetical protein n=1 Tax=Methanospirillum sp. TaxID=45200 RepID=UPI0035A04262